MSLALVNVFAAVLALTLVFGGPVGFLIKMVVTGKEPDEILQSLACKTLPYEELLYKGHMYEKRINNGGEKVTHGKGAHETVVNEKAIHKSGNSGSPERRVS